MPSVNGVDDLLALWGPDRVLALFEQASPAQEGASTYAQQLVELASDAVLFHTPERQAYARIPVGGHIETWPIRNRDFRDWLMQRFYRKVRKPPSTQALQEALGLIEAKAKFDGEEAEVFVRLASYEEKIYVDLVNAEWEAIEITVNGWRIITDPPVNFRRTRGMKPLARPERGGEIATLRKFINVGSDQHNWILCLSWLVAGCRPEGPFPVLILQGEQGSAKSTLAKMLRRIIDGSSAPLRTPPRDERDLMIAAINSWVLAYDNISSIPAWLSDALCRLATGGGFSTRELYTDSEEVLFSATRPVILNGIDHLAERPDLADRAVILCLPRIAEEDRRDEKTLWAEFDVALPGIFGCLLDGVAEALAKLPDVKLSAKPRMADFALWAVAAAESLGYSADAFLEAYRGNRAESVEATLEEDAVACAIHTLIDRDAGSWQGSAKELLQDLGAFVDPSTQKSPAWPKTARGCSGRLRRLMTFLREVGIIVEFKKTGGRRKITITRLPGHPTDPTATTDPVESADQSKEPFEREPASDGLDSK